ncbi:hypothetical protein ASPFODRAFT_51111 [Aspergillus luchuensis CBS 106.47]|uniref:Uncharacterized protein n=1 Tax=Aspergillus luchuensis (strain CBS 106.47) TaxID=1137211 RepID=A0A1M3T666_ASPLC|nr:hypothetical protein ASPFODRAFT_51111 [Aspergillus luchuensis CBS 106.47]
MTSENRSRRFRRFRQPFFCVLPTPSLSFLPALPFSLGGTDHIGGPDLLDGRKGQTGY